MVRVLLVDDSNSNRAVLGALLTDEGMEVVHAGSSGAANGILEKSDPGAPFDVVLLDQHLGDGLGTDLVPIIKSLMPAARLVLISGSWGDDPVPSSVRF